MKDKIIDIVIKTLDGASALIAKLSRIVKRRFRPELIDMQGDPVHIETPNKQISGENEVKAEMSAESPEARWRRLNFDPDKPVRCELQKIGSQLRIIFMSGLYRGECALSLNGSELSVPVFKGKAYFWQQQLETLPIESFDSFKVLMASPQKTLRYIAANRIYPFINSNERRLALQLRQVTEDEWNAPLPEIPNGKNAGTKAAANQEEFDLVPKQTISSLKQQIDNLEQQLKDNNDRSEKVDLGNDNAPEFSLFFKNSHDNPDSAKLMLSIADDSFEKMRNQTVTLLTLDSREAHLVEQKELTIPLRNFQSAEAASQSPICLQVNLVDDCIMTYALWMPTDADSGTSDAVPVVAFRIADEFTTLFNSETHAEELPMPREKDDPENGEMAENEPDETTQSFVIEKGMLRIQSGNPLTLTFDHNSAEYTGPVELIIDPDTDIMEAAESQDKQVQFQDVHPEIKKRLWDGKLIYLSILDLDSPLHFEVQLAEKSEDFIKDKPGEYGLVCSLMTLDADDDW